MSTPQEPGEGTHLMRNMGFKLFRYFLPIDEEASWLTELSADMA